MTYRAPTYRAAFDEARMFGVELEVYGVESSRIAAQFRRHGLANTQVDYTRELLPNWKICKDGSIMGPEPVEVASPTLSGREGLAEVDKVIHILNDMGCQINSSCGFHVHWCCGDYTGKNVQSLLRLYAKFEDVIDYLVSPSRRGNGNKYCRTMVKDADLGWVTELDPTEKQRALQVALKFGSTHIEWDTDPETGRPVDRGSRYHKLNISAYSQYGTVEFRQHQGTLNGDKAINWIIFTQQMVNKAKHVSVSRQVSAKPTLGELLRVLKIVDYQLGDDTDPLVRSLGEWLKNRYTMFREGSINE